MVLVGLVLTQMTSMKVLSYSVGTKVEENQSDLFKGSHLNPTENLLSIFMKDSNDDDDDFV